MSGIETYGSDHRVYYAPRTRLLSLDMFSKMFGDHMPMHTWVSLKEAIPSAAYLLKADIARLRACTLPSPTCMRKEFSITISASNGDRINIPAFR